MKKLPCREGEEIAQGLVAQLVKNPPAMQETWVRSLGWEDPLEKGKATHSSILAGEFHGLYSPWGHKEADTTERLSLSGNLMQFIYFSGCNNPFEGHMSDFLPLLVYNSMSLWTTTSFFPSGHHYHPKIKHWPQVTKHIVYDVQVNLGKKWLWTLTLCAIEGTCIDDMGSIV